MGYWFQDAMVLLVCVLQLMNDAFCFLPALYVLSGNISNSKQQSIQVLLQKEENVAACSLTAHNM